MDNKKCLVCGKEFTPSKPNAKWCSAACRKVGQRQTRKVWEHRTGYSEKKKLEARERRAMAAAVRLEKETEAREVVEERFRIHAEQMREKLERKAAAGDPASVMMIEKENGYTSEYWKAYQKREIEFSELSGRTSTRTVNGISVYEDDFPDRVLESIKETGHIISEVSGKGMKL